MKNEHTHAHTHTHTHTHTHKRMHTCICTHVYAHIHPPIPTHIFIHTYTHVHYNNIILTFITQCHSTTVQFFFGGVSSHFSTKLQKIIKSLWVLNITNINMYPHTYHHIYVCMKSACTYTITHVGTLCSVRVYVC